MVGDLTSWRNEDERDGKGWCVQGSGGGGAAVCAAAALLRKRRWKEVGKSGGVGCLGFFISSWVPLLMSTFTINIVR